MKKIKSTLCFMFIFIFSVSLFFVSAHAGAQPTTTENKNYTSLEAIAEDYIVKETLTDEYGVTMTITTKIPEFVVAVHKYMPHVKDITTARFLYKYTEKGDSVKSLPNEIVLEILTSEEVVVQAETLSPEGNSIRNTLFADDGNTVKFILITIFSIGLIITIIAVLTSAKKKHQKRND